MLLKKTEAVAALWQDVLQWYRTQPANITRIDKLKLEHFAQDKKPPKLKCKAAAARQLVPFLPALCEKYLLQPEHTTSVNTTISNLTKQLHQTYQALYSGDAELLARNCRNTCILWKSLQTHLQTLEPGTNRWKMKPKVHVFQELCEFQTQERGSPMQAWCYKDEDFGGYLQKLQKKRRQKHCFLCSNWGFPQVLFHQSFSFGADSGALPSCLNKTLLWLFHLVCNYQIIARCKFVKPWH